MTFPADKFDEERAREFLVAWEIKRRRLEAIKILVQAERYVSAYLKDYRISISKDFEGEPLTLTVRVYTIPVDLLKEEEEGKAEKEWGV